ncbi:MAG: hypothetical protein ACP5XB_05845 [Isosphaeraceae bacterium]
MIAALSSPVRAVTPLEPVFQAHDFGVVLAFRQTLWHEFSLRNNTARPIRIVRGVALAPCCSEIRRLPESVPPRGQVKVQVALKPGNGSGSKEVRFVVEAESGGGGPYVLGLKAQLAPAWEVVPLTDGPTSLAIGEEGERTFRLIVRRLGTEGRSLPQSISVAPPLTVAFKGPATTKSGRGGLSESMRDFTLRIPAGRKPAAHEALVTMLWPSGLREDYPVTWEVRPHLWASPSALILKASSQPVERAVVVSSDGRPFRIISISGRLLDPGTSRPSGAATAHCIVLRIAPSAAAAERPENVGILTDHPDQTSVRVSILVLRD